MESNGILNLIISWHLQVLPKTSPQSNSNCHLILTYFLFYLYVFFLIILHLNQNDLNMLELNISWNLPQFLHNLQLIHQWVYVILKILLFHDIHNLPYYLYMQGRFYILFFNVLLMILESYDLDHRDHHWVCNVTSF